MTYQVLARKLRPRTFDEVIGQEHVTTPLRNALRADRVPHAILLTGPRGTGKTTLARILACCLNAEKGPTETPDPDDPVCREIAAGTSTDVQEIDAASRTSVDDVRELIEAVRYAPTPGKHRIYIVDEVHMLSTAAFNALLKTLEEPPAHTLFVFCTTNPEKIPFTVVSRCQRYDLRLIGTGEVTAYLGRVAKEEGIEISDASLLAIARAAGGSMRDSLTLLDQLLAYGGGRVDDAQVAQVLDLIDTSLVRSILAGCVDGDAAAALDASRRAFEQGVDATRMGSALLEGLRDLVILHVAPDRGLVEGSEADLGALREIAERAEPARLRRMFRALLREQEDLAWAPEPFAVLEMAVVRLATMPAGDDVGRLLQRLEDLEQRLRGEAPGGGDAGPGGGRDGGTGGARASRGGSRSSGGRRSGDRSTPRADGRPEGSPSGPGVPDAVAAGAPPAEAVAGPSEAVDAPPAEATANAPPAEAPADGPPSGATADGPPSGANAEGPPSAASGDEPPRAASGDEPPSVSAPEDAASKDAAPDDAPPDVPAVEPPQTIAGAGEAAPVADPADPALAAAEPPPAGAEAAPTDAALPAVFDRLHAFAVAENKVLFAALEGGCLVLREEDRIRLSLPTQIAARRLELRRTDLEDVCRRFFGRRMRVEIGSSAAPPAGRAAADPRAAAGAASAAAERRQEALRHPAVNDALEILDGEILDIRPLGGAPGPASEAGP